MDLEYYQKLFTNKKLIDFLKNSEKEKIKTLLKLQQDADLMQEGANNNEIKKFYNNLSQTKCKESDDGYDNIRDIIDMLMSVITYKRTLCIDNNLVVLNDKYMRDNIDMTSFKYGGKIKVLGYITNTIGNNSDNSLLPDFAQLGISLNEVMLSFFTQQSSLNIIHPIAIYYE